jgi:DNA-binding transcriptional ArsR family regulator
MEKKIVIVPVNGETEAEVLFATLKEFPTERMILLYSSDGFEKAEGFKDDLRKLGIESNLVKVDGKNQWDSYFRATVDVCEGLEKEKIVINISTADRISQCAITNAAHVNGLRAVAILNGKMVMLPILRMSFSNVLSEKKMKILEALEGNCIGSLEEISKKTGMSLQLVSYHINGTPKSPGLVKHEMIETKSEKGKIRVCLSTMGKLFMQGYLRSER